jgi:hypothetical protein
MTMEEDVRKEGGGVVRSWRSQSSGYDCDDDDNHNDDEEEEEEEIIDKLHSSSRCRHPPPSRIFVNVDVIE